MFIPQQNIGLKMKEACENVTLAVKNLSIALHKLDRNSAFLPIGSKFHS